MRLTLVISLFGALLALHLSAPQTLCAATLETRYASLIYADSDQLRIFNTKLDLGGLSFNFSRNVSTDMPGEVRKKLNQLNARVQEILEMKPLGMKFRIELLPGRQQVQKIYQEQFGKNVDFIAFYSPKTKTVYFSLSDVRLRVFVHEIAHAVIDHYFDKAPPVKLHEVMAQYVESNF